MTKLRHGQNILFNSWFAFGGEGVGGGGGGEEEAGMKHLLLYKPRTPGGRFVQQFSGLAERTSPPVPMKVVHRNKPVNPISVVK